MNIGFSTLVVVCAIVSGCNVSGSVYTRWGRKSCGVNSALLYEGFAAGGYYDENGSGSNYQCLPLNPQYDNATVTGNYIAKIYGAEYQTEHYDTSIPDAAFQQNVPCAVCYSWRTDVVMIPARRVCPKGWTQEYQGYLMAERQIHKHTSTYECVDGNPEYVEGEEANKNGALFYFTKADCEGNGRTGHCPPYDSDKVLLCVVCSF